MDEDRCLNCSCTFETGCREEQRTNATLKTLLEQRRRPIPPKYCTAPPVPQRKTNPEAARAYGRQNYRRRIERLGGTVRVQKPAR